MKKLICFGSLIFLLSQSAFAASEEVLVDPPIPAAQVPQEPVSTWDKVKEAAVDTYDYGKKKVSDANQNLDAARLNRLTTKWSITGNYSYLDLWVVSKYGITFSYNESASTSYEFEYLKGTLGFKVMSIDIGEIAEKRFSLRKRSFAQRNTFNYFYGLYYNHFDIHLGSDLLATVSASKQANASIMELATMGVTWGLGNRWQTEKGFVWGFDWFSVNLPLLTLKEKAPFVDESSSEDKKRDAKNALSLLKSFPALAVFKVQLGLSF